MRIATLKTGPAPLDQRTARPAPKVAASFYLTKEWRDARTVSLALANYTCAHCGARGQHNQGGLGVRLFVDHIAELSDGGEPYDQSNLQVLCGSCHAYKTHKERQNRYSAPTRKGRG